MLDCVRATKARIYRKLFMIVAVNSTIMIGSVAVAQNSNPYFEPFPNNSFNQNNTFPNPPVFNPQQQYYCSTLGRYCSVFEFNQDQVQSQIRNTLPSSTQSFPSRPVFNPEQQYYCSTLGRYCSVFEFNQDQVQSQIRNTLPSSTQSFPSRPAFSPW